MREVLREAIIDAGCSCDAMNGYRCGIHDALNAYEDWAFLPNIPKFILKQKEKNNWGLWFGIYLLTTGSHLEMLHAKAILEAAFARVQTNTVEDATGCSHTEQTPYVPAHERFLD